MTPVSGGVGVGRPGRGCRALVLGGVALVELAAGFGCAGGLERVGVLHHVLHTAHLQACIPACGEGGGRDDCRAATRCGGSN